MTVYLITNIHRYVGLAADVKPTTGVPVGSRFLQADTPSEYIHIGAAIAATGVLTLTAQPEVGDTILIGATTYTFVAEVDADTAGEIGIGADTDAAVVNIVAAINGTDGFNAADPAVTAEATGAAEITVTAITAGAAANSDDSVYTNSGLGTNAFGAATLAGGFDVWQVLP